MSKMLTECEVPIIFLVHSMGGLIVKEVGRSFLGSQNEASHL